MWVKNCPKFCPRGLHTPSSIFLYVSCYCFSHTYWIGYQLARQLLSKCCWCDSNFTGLHNSSKNSSLKTHFVRKNNTWTRKTMSYNQQIRVRVLRFNYPDSKLKYEIVKIDKNILMINNMGFSTGCTEKIYSLYRSIILLGFGICPI